VKVREIRLPWDMDASAIAARLAVDFDQVTVIREYHAGGTNTNVLVRAWNEPADQEWPT
jgi:hypothetical protein